MDNRPGEERLHNAWWAAILLIVLSRGFDPTRHPWQRVYLYGALAVFFAALLVWAMDATSLRGVPNRFYNLRVLRAIGRYSFGIYVLHLPLYYITILAAARWRVLWTGGRARCRPPVRSTASSRGR